MHLRAFKQIGHCRKANMGMRAHIDAFSGCKIDWPEIVEEHEWPDRALRRIGKNPADMETVAKIARVTFDCDHVRLVAGRHDRNLG